MEKDNFKKTLEKLKEFLAEAREMVKSVEYNSEEYSAYDYWSGRVDGLRTLESYMESLCG